MATKPPTSCVMLSPFDSHGGCSKCFTPTQGKKSLNLALNKDLTGVWLCVAPKQGTIDKNTLSHPPTTTLTKIGWFSLAL